MRWYYLRFFGVLLRRNSCGHSPQVDEKIADVGKAILSKRATVDGGQTALLGGHRRRGLLALAGDGGGRLGHGQNAAAGRALDLLTGQFVLDLQVLPTGSTAEGEHDGPQNEALGSKGTTARALGDRRSQQFRIPGPTPRPGG